MNRRDPNAPRQQGGGYGSQDNNRQAGQWQADPSQQAGGDWGNEQSTYRLGGNDPQDEFGGSRGGFEQQDRSQGAYSPPRSQYSGGYGQGGQSGQQRGNSYGARYNSGYGAEFSSFTGNDFGGRDFSARSGDSGRSGYGSPSGSDEYGSWRQYGESRGFFERAGDAIASWFGDEDATRRREEDHRGRGPSDYTRSDERIREDVNDKLTHDWRVDARNVTVSVKDGEVTLEGRVDSREAKRRAEDVADNVSGVKHVQNNLRVQDNAAGTSSGVGGTGASTTGVSGIPSTTPKTN